MRRPQPAQELELLRLKLEEGMISHARGEREFKRITAGMTRVEKDRLSERRLIDIIAVITKVSQEGLVAMGVEP